MKSFALGATIAAVLQAAVPVTSAWIVAPRPRMNNCATCSQRSAAVWSFCRLVKALKRAKQYHGVSQ